MLTGADLAGWSASYERPVVQRFRDVEVAKTDLWGQGPVLLQALAMLDGLPDEAFDPTTADGVHTVTEVLQARAGRPRGVVRRRRRRSPLPQLLDPAYVETRLALVGDRASARAATRQPRRSRSPVLPAYGR